MGTPPIKTLILADVQRDFARGWKLGSIESEKGIVEIAETFVGKGSEGVYTIIGVSGISLPPRFVSAK